MAGVGALIGTSFRTPEEANAVDRLLTVLMLALGPVLVQPRRLPSWLVTLGYLSPAAYANVCVAPGLPWPGDQSADPRSGRVDQPP
ncbi:MAG: ABC transporter permease [Caldilineaceae bacterium]